MLSREELERERKTAQKMVKDRDNIRILLNQRFEYASQNAGRALRNHRCGCYADPGLIKAQRIRILGLNILQYLYR